MNRMCGLADNISLVICTLNFWFERSTKSLNGRPSPNELLEPSLWSDRSLLPTSANDWMHL